MSSHRYPGKHWHRLHIGQLSFLHPFVSKKTLGFRQRADTQQLRGTSVMKSRPFMTVATAKGASDYLYFGYGSNMSRTKMRTRGVSQNKSEPSEIEFTDVWVGRLEDWQLCMNLRGSPPSEPAFGNIRPCKGDEVYGVVYRLKTEASWEKLKRSEGVRDQQRISGYRVIQVSVECFSPDSPSEKTIRTVNTLVSAENGILPRRLESVVLPSSRYMNLLISGAKEEGLPQSYIKRLEHMPAARLWGGSLLPEMGLLLSVLYFNLVRARMSGVVTPFRIAIINLYGFHESFARKENKKPHDRVGIMFCQIAMFCVYLIPNLATVFLFVCKRQSWERYQKFRRMRFAPNSPKALTTAKAS